MLKKLLFCFLLSSGLAYSQCTPVAQAPPYGFFTIPGQSLNVNVKETGCPTATISTIATSGTIVSIVGSGFGSFTVGKTVILQNLFNPGFGSPYPYDQLTGVAMTILSQTSTTLTATYNHSIASGGASSFTGQAVQPSLVNWSVANSIGTVTATVNCTSNCLPNVKLTMGNVNGGCHETGSLGSYTVVASQQVTVTATTVDTGNTTTFTVGDCAKTTQTWIDGSEYYQVYPNQKLNLVGAVTGNSNHAITWSITAQPGGGDGVLDVTNKRNTRFHATVHGTYTLHAVSVDDASKTDDTYIYVSTATKPSWFNSPVEKAETFPCEVNASATSIVYDVGPTQTYHHLLDVPWNTFSSGGHIIRLHNEDTGTTPTSYAEVVETSTPATAAHPDIICGVPNALGYYPIMEASGAVTPSYYDIFLYGSGLIVSFPPGGCYGTYPSATCASNHLLIFNIKFQHATFGYTGVQADGSTPFNWGQSAAINIHTGSNISIMGNHMYQCSLGVSTYENGDDHFWAAVSKSIDIQRNNLDTIGGTGGDFLDHPLYNQSFVMNVMGNKITHNPGAPNSASKFRGLAITYWANSIGSGFARITDWVENQDADVYVDLFGLLGDGRANGDAMSVDMVVGFQESNYDDNVQFSNIYNDPTAAIAEFHLLADHDDQNGNFGMNSKYGNLWSFYETSYICGSTFDNFGPTNAENYFLTPNSNMFNNIQYCPSPGRLSLNTVALFTGNFRTNLFRTGTLDLTTPIYGGRYNAADYTGWTNDWFPGIWFMASPMQARFTGSLVSDFLFTPIAPFDTTTLHLVNGSAAANAASGLTGEANLFAVNMNAVDLNGTITERTTTTDVGAFMYTGTPPPPPISTTMFGLGKSFGKSKSYGH